MSKGWIKVDRKLMDNPLWCGREPFDKRSAWIDLLLMANHSDHEIFSNGHYIEVKRGQVNRSLSQLSERWRWSRNKVRLFLDALEASKMVHRESTNNGTVLTIENYAKYQDGRTTDGTADGQQKDNQRTTEGQLKDTYKNDKELKRMINNDYIRPQVAEDRLTPLRKRREEVNKKWQSKLIEL